MYQLYSIIFVFLFASCAVEVREDHDFTPPQNVLDYKGLPTSANDRAPFVFSDQGAWFGYSFPTNPSSFGGFSGPFIMTQENGKWISPVLSQLELMFEDGTNLNWNSFSSSTISYLSHLEQIFSNQEFIIQQKLLFVNETTALISTTIKNTSSKSVIVKPKWQGEIFLEGIEFQKMSDGIAIISDKSTARGSIIVDSEKIEKIDLVGQHYEISLNQIQLAAGESKSLILAHEFSFNDQITVVNGELSEEFFDQLLEARKVEKEKQLLSLYAKMDTTWHEEVYENLMAKTVLTLQNNWKSAAGELKYEGLFPSYHYIWFNGFWAWDSWKHAVALAQYDTELAKNQIRAMYDFQTEDGFIPDCVYRDTTIENHNYRNTKPPLSGWAVWEVYQVDQDIKFLSEMYPKILAQHNWWYTKRDHDKDGLCEYGSTDGSLIAAKWESGMDNAVRFDSSQIMKNSDQAYSLDQESVDLNAYLYAEKVILSHIAKLLSLEDASESHLAASEILKTKVQQQFFDPESGWFYDTNLDGSSYIKVMGCEGWIPLWANIATPEQAIAVRNSMMNNEHFNTLVPLQTLSASHPDFNPNGGYWRGPNWLDQAYFGVKGLRNYSFNEEADQLTYKLFHNAEGLLEKGPAIRENYQPITGEGLESYNFSWSAAHYLLLLLNK